MNALRILAIGLVIVAGIGVSTATIAAPVHTAQPLILPADPPKTKTPEAGKTSDDKTGDERVAQSIAKFFGVPVADVLTLHNSGKGYGEIVKAYALAQGSGKSVNDIFASARETETLGVSGQVLAQMIRAKRGQVYLAPGKAATLARLQPLVKKDDVILTLGAGNNWLWHKDIIKLLRQI